MDKESWLSQAPQINEAIRARLIKRLEGRQPIVVACAVLACLFVWLGGLGAGAGLAGVLGVALWAAMWPTGTTTASSGQELSPLAGSAMVPTAALSDAAIWRAMLAALPDAAMVLDPQGMVVALNPQAQTILSATVGRHVALVNRAPELLGGVEAALADGAQHEFDMRLSVPVERHLAGLVAPLRASEPRSREPALLVILRDVTEQESLAQMRADFVANASHELRTPLASLMGFVETLQGAAKDDPLARERFLTIMQEQASRMARLIDDLLSLSRIEMREHVAPTASVDLAAVAAEAVAGLKPLADSNRITLALAPADAGMIVIGDRDELTQVAQNLIQNAIKYGNADGRIDVALDRVERRIALSVTDDGIGIAPEHVPRLTERFYRVNAKASRERGGTGLGLAIVKHIVNRHQGELRIASEVGKGSTFTVLLPRGATGHMGPIA